jgi:uncharacterized delta-60 repeat protein
MSRKLVAYTVVGVALVTALAAGAGASASGRGRLDPSFGDGGRVVLNGIRECLPGEGGCWAGMGMALQRNGMIVTAGGTLDADCGSRFAVARLRKSGRPDRAFGDGGRVLTAFGRSAVAHAVVVLPDNRIVVGGELLDTESPCPNHLHLGDGRGFALARYRPDGTLDPSFGNDGTVVTQFDHGAGLDVLLQPDGKIVMVGSSNGSLALARYTGDGSLDPSFGRQGVVVRRFGNWDFTAQQAELDKAGRILVPFSSWCGNCPSGGCDDCPSYLVRYKANGRLDTTFGQRGRAAIDLLYINAVEAFQRKIVVAGNAQGQPGRLAVSRLSSSGQVDRSFGRSGTRVLRVGWAFLPVLAIERNGVMLVAAGVRPHDVKGLDNFNFSLTRILANGAVDQSFGRNGTVTDDFGGVDFGQAVAVQPNGKLLVAGVIGPVSNGIGLARHLP